MASVYDILEALNTYHVCEGNSDERFLQLSHSQHGRLMDVSGKAVKPSWGLQCCVYRLLY